MLVLVAVILLLGTRAWKAFLPTALQVAAPARPPGHPDEDGKQAAAHERKSSLSDLEEMKKGTDAHAGQVKEALDESE